MLPEVTAVEVVGAHCLRLAFSDGSAGDVDFTKHFRFEGVFSELADPVRFAQARLDVDAGTVTWPNGADLDPIVLHSIVTGKPLPSTAPAGPR